MPCEGALAPGPTVKGMARIPRCQLLMCTGPRTRARGVGAPGHPHGDVEGQLFAAGQAGAGPERGCTPCCVDSGFSQGGRRAPRSLLPFCPDKSRTCSQHHIRWPGSPPAAWPSCGHQPWTSPPAGLRLAEVRRVLPGQALCSGSAWSMDARPPAGSTEVSP